MMLAAYMGKDYANPRLHQKFISTKYIHFTKMALTICEKKNQMFIIILKINEWLKQ